MTIPNTRHLDALVATYVLKLEDVRLGWIYHDQYGVSIQREKSDDDTRPYIRDYIYKAREPWAPLDKSCHIGDTGYEIVDNYASDGNAMLELLRLLERQQTYIEDANSFQPEYKTTVKLYSPKLGIISRGTGDALPEAVGWASLDMLERHARWKGDQSFDVRRELQRLEDAYQEAINQKGVEHA